VILYAYNMLLGISLIIALIGYGLYKIRTNFYVLKGNKCYSSGNIEGAVEYYRKGYKTERLSPGTTVGYAYLLLKSGNIPEAEKILTILLNKKLKKEDEMFAKSNLALVYWKKDRLEDALTLLEDITQNYKTSIVYGTYGYLLILGGDLEKALSFNLEAYEYNNDNNIIVDNLGQTYFLIGELEKSTEIYEKLIAKKPSFPEAYYNYGLVLEAINDFSKALEMVTKSLDYKLSFLSTITCEEIKAKIDDLTEKCPKVDSN